MANPHCTHPGGPAYCKSSTCPGRARYLDFKNNAKPVSAMEEVLDESDYSSYETYTTIQDEVDGIFEYAYEIEFANHGDNKEEYLTLQDLIDDPANIRGNCMPVSEAIIENMQLDDSYEVDAVQLSYKKGFHIGVGIKTPDNEELVLDFTMKQFDNEAPMPYLGRRADWEQRIDSYINNIWLDSRKNDNNE